MKNEIAFVAGPPVRGASFFGRKSLLHSVLQRAYTQQSTIITGTRRIGKSSILLKVGEIVSSESEPSLILRLEPSFVRDSDEFVHYLATQMLEQAKQLPKQTIAHKISRALQPPSKGKKYSQVAIVQACDVLEHNRVPVVLFIDEIDSLFFQLPKEEASRFAAIFREFASGKFSIVCSSFRDPISIRFWERGSAWYNVFAIEQVGLFTDEEALEMLTELSERSGNKFTENECRFVMEIFGNFPFYLQSVGFELFARAQFRSAQGHARKQAFVEAIPQVAHQLEEWHFRYLIEHLADDELSLIMNVARNKSISKKDEKTFWKLNRLGLLVGTIQNPQVSSLILAEFIRAIPEQSILEKASKSPFWERIREFVWDALNTATIKAIETATSKYL